MKKLLSVVAFCLSLLLLFTSCSAKMKGDNGESPEENLYPNMQDQMQAEGNADVDSEDDPNAPTFRENPFVATQEQAVSTFSADVDTASYSYFRKLVNSECDAEYLKSNGAAFRTEEFINYFDYSAESPKNGELFGVTPSVIPCPWNPNTVLLRLTLKAEEAIPEGGNNLVFLIDVSGSMSSSDKLPLLKKAFSALVSNLTEEDRVSIVTYSGKEEVILEGCAGNQGERILTAINSLSAKGSTNGEAGLREAYRIAEENKIENGNNRIIMASDGDLNVGISSADELKAFVEEKRESGVFLSVLGFGTGNYRDSNMETLADNGNGVYYYIDGETEAEKVFGTDLLSTLYTVAKDVKLQLTFDPAAISSWRLIGYENRLLSEEDFTDDTKDAGEVGAGHLVTVCYELTLTAAALESDSWMKLAVAYKRMNETASQINEYSIGNPACCEPDPDLVFLSALIETAMILHGSAYLQDVNFENVLDLLNSLDLSEYPERAEFKALIQRLVA